MKNLENYGVLEMDTRENREIDGGTEICYGQCVGGDLGGSTVGSRTQNNYDVLMLTGELITDVIKAIFF